MTLTPHEVRRVAHAYAQETLFTIHFITGVQLSEADLDRVLTAVHDQLVAAWVAGYTAGSGDDEEAA